GLSAFTYRLVTSARDAAVHDTPARDALKGVPYKSDLGDDLQEVEYHKPDEGDGLQAAPTRAGILEAEAGHDVRSERARVDTHADTLRALAAWGLPVEAHWRRCANIDEVTAF